jgi:hypothetical protein
MAALGVTDALGAPPHSRITWERGMEVSFHETDLRLSWQPIFFPSKIQVEQHAKTMCQWAGGQAFKRQSKKLSVWNACPLGFL